MLRGGINWKSGLLLFYYIILYIYYILLYYINNYYTHDGQATRSCAAQETLYQYLVINQNEKEYEKESV